MLTLENYKLFCNVYQPQRWLMEQGCLMPQLPNDTMKFSSWLCEIICNYHKYRKKHLNIAKNFLQIFSKFWKMYLSRRSASKNQLSVVANVLNKLQKKNNMHFRSCWNLVRLLPLMFSCLTIIIQLNISTGNPNTF